MIIISFLEVFKDWSYTLNIQIKTVGEISKIITDLYFDMKDFPNQYMAVYRKLKKLRETKKWKLISFERKQN